MEEVKADQPREKDLEGGCTELEDHGCIDGAPVALEVELAELGRLGNCLAQFEDRIREFNFTCHEKIKFEFFKKVPAFKIL